MTRLGMAVVTIAGALASAAFLGVMVRAFLWGAGITIIFAACSSAPELSLPTERPTDTEPAINGTAAPITPKAHPEYLAECMEDGTATPEICGCAWGKIVDYYGDEARALSAMRENNEGYWTVATQSGLGCLFP